MLSGEHHMLGIGMTVTEAAFQSALLLGMAIHVVLEVGFRLEVDPPIMEVVAACPLLHRLLGPDAGDEPIDSSSK